MKDFKFSKKLGGPIDAGVAKKWMEKYQECHKEKNCVHAYFFGSDLIRKIIDHPEAVGMRVYFGYGDEDKKQVILIGTREDGSNIWPNGGKDGSSGTVGDQGYPSPPY